MATAAIGYAAFGPRPAKERSDGRLVLDYWEKWTQNEADAMRAIVDRFNQSQQRLFVRYFSTGTIDQKAMIAIAGGNPPDILGLDNFSVPAYAESGAVLPLDDMVKRSSIRREAYVPAIWPMLTHPPASAPWNAGATPKQYAVINTCGGLAMFYNRTLFREAGLDPDNPPRTIEELDAAHRKLCLFWSGKPGHSATTAQDDGRRDIARVGLMHSEPNWWSWHWGYSFGGSIYDAGTDRATPDSPENVRAYQWLQSYPQELGVERLVRFQTGFGFYGTAENPFLTGKVAMMYQGPWLANVIRQYLPDLDYGVAPFPVHESVYDPKRPIGLLNGDVLVIPRGAKHPEASFEFIAFTQRPENIEALSIAHGKNSPLIEHSPGFERASVNKYVAVHAQVARSDRAFVFPRTRTWQQYASEFDAATQGMLRLQSPATEALARVRVAAQTQLDRTAEARRRRAGA